MKNEVQFGIQEFILGGISEFTILQEAFGGKRAVEAKYKVKKSYNNSNMYFVYTQETSRGDMMYHGYIIKNTQGFKYFRAKTLKFASEYYNESAMTALSWVLAHAGRLPAVVHVLHHGRCSRCGRKLTDSESLRYGLGPECRRKMGLNW